MPERILTSTRLAAIARQVPDRAPQPVEDFGHLLQPRLDETFDQRSSLGRFELVLSDADLARLTSRDITRCRPGQASLVSCKVLRQLTQGARVAMDAVSPRTSLVQSDHLLRQDGEQQETAAVTQASFTLEDVGALVERLLCQREDLVERQVQGVTFAARVVVRGDVFRRVSGRVRIRH